MGRDGTRRPVAGRPPRSGHGRWWKMRTRDEGGDGSSGQLLLPPSPRPQDVLELDASSENEKNSSDDGSDDEDYEGTNAEVCSLSCLRVMCGEQQSGVLSDHLQVAGGLVMSRYYKRTVGRYKHWDSAPVTLDG